MDEFNNLIDTGRFLREMAVIEKGQDEPEPHQFKRDQNLTPQALFKAKVLAVLSKERLKWKQGPSALCAIDSVFAAIEAIEP